MIGHIVSHYRILEKLGEGGMGEVFLAEDTKLGRKTALKFLPAETTGDNDARRRFEREARAAAALNHPNIVTIHEIDEFENRVYIAMEYVEGVTLREKIRFLDVRLSDSGDEETALLETMPVDLLIGIAVQICEGLEEAHRAGIIHRDIKLQNIIVDKNNRVKILDFGLAKLKGASKITGEISRVGTIYYMSPEQAQGEDVDLRTDIWSLGVVLYELVTGRPPFEGDHEQAVIRAIIHDSPQPPSEMRDDLPRGLEKIIFKCLCKNRGDRYASAGSLKTDLENLQRSLTGEKPADTAEQEVRPPQTKETERRQATVLFAEITGYDRVLKKLDAEEAASLMKTCFEMFGSIVEKYGGSIDRIMGSGLTALFGVPTALEGAAKSAVNAAIEMRNRLYEFNREKNLPIALDIRVGINTGMVIAGALGDETRDYSVVGETVTFASRLKALAKKGTIYTGPLTYRYTKDQFQYRELKLVIIKGRAKPATVFKLLTSEEKIHRPRLEPERITDSIMVGRDKELDKLKLHLLKVINGEGSIVSITGDAGMGKSRLLAELKKSTDMEKVTLLEGRALSFGENLSYHPFTDILKNWAGIKEGENETVSLSRLERAVSETCIENADEVFPFLALVMGMNPTGKHAARLKGIEGAALEKLIFKSMRQLLIKCSQQRPVVFIIEDLQWADISSVELLESLFRTAEKHPILFIDVLRPNHKNTGGRILETADIRYSGIHTVIPLLPLGEKDCETIIRSLAKVEVLSSSTVKAVTNRAEGNPSFVEEIARSFLDAGMTEVKEEDVDLTDKIETLVIPKTIRDVLMVRIDRLDEPTRTLVKEASVIGRYFFHKVLAGVTETRGDIGEKLERLKEVQLIGERTRLGETEYYFKHALAREAAYESLLLTKRKELHLKTAAAIDSVFPGRQFEFYGLLALHYNRGENLEKAEEYLLKAGQEALKAAASIEALVYYKDALELYRKKYAAAADPEKIALLEKNIARAYYNKGQMTEAVRHFDILFELRGEKRTRRTFPALVYFVPDLLKVIKTLYFPPKRPPLKPSPRDNDIFEAAYLRGTALGVVDPHRMFRDTIRLLKDLRKYDPSEVRGGVATWSLAAGIFFFSGLSFRIARRILDYARRYITPGNWQDRFTFDLFELSFHALTGDWDRTAGCDFSIVDKSLQSGDLFIAPIYLLLCGFLEQEQGRFAAVAAYSDKLNHIAETYENDSVRIIRHLLMARFLLQRRDLTAALRETETGTQLSGRAGHDVFLLIFAGLKANIQILQGDLPEARESLKHTEQMLAGEKTVTPVHISSYRLSRFLYDIYCLEKSVREGDKMKVVQYWEEARRSGRNAVKTAEKCAVYRTETYRLKGLYYWLTGRQKKALNWWSKSINTGHQLNAAPELARTYREVGRRLSEKKSKFRQWKGMTAAEYLKNARRLFERMEIEWDLRLLDNNNV